MIDCASSTVCWTRYKVQGTRYNVVLMLIAYNAATMALLGREFSLLRDIVLIERR